MKEKKERVLASAAHILKLERKKERWERKEIRKKEQNKFKKKKVNIQTAVTALSLDSQWKPACPP